MQSRYKHVLLSNDSGERIVLQQAPDGWNAQRINLIRDLVYIGMLKSISVEYEFVGDGFRFLQKQRLRYGMDASIIIRVYDHTDFKIEGKVNLENYFEDHKFRRFKVDIIQSSFVQKFQNREDIKINILNDTSLDRIAVASTLLHQATIRGKIIKFYTEFDGSTFVDPILYHHTLPFLLKVNGNSGVSDISGGQIEFTGWVASTLVIEDSFDNPMFLVVNAVYENNLSEVQTIKMDFHVNFTALYLGVVSDFARNSIVFRILKMNADNSVHTQLFFRDVVHKDGSTNLDLVFNQSITVDPGQYVLYVVERWGRTVINPFYAPLYTSDMDADLKTEITYNVLTLTIEQDSIVADTSHPVVLPHELFTNLVGQINGGTFYSEIFGRIDLGYAEDGKGAYVSTIPGTWLRGIPIEETQYTTSFREAFKSYSSIFCLGAIIKDNQIQIDTLDKLFNNEVCGNLGEVQEFGLEPTKEFLFNSVKAGYPSNDYEQENGRDEYNTPTQYTNSFQCIKKELDLMSIFCGDGYGIEFARRAGVIHTGTSDSRFDEKIFFLDLIKVGDELISRRLEAPVLHVEGIFSPETAINLNIAVGQNMLRWKKFLNSPLHFKEKVYYFQSKEKNSDLILITELGTSNDGEDIDTGSEAYFIADEGRRFKSTITTPTLVGIMANPLGLIRYAYHKETFYDYILNVNAEKDKSISEWRALGTKSTPPDVVENPIFGPFVKYDSGLQDFVKYDTGTTDVIKYDN